MKKNYNEILKKSVEESGFTHKEIGEKLGESQQTISNWLNKNDISLLKFIRSCDAIGINPAFIVDNGKDNFSDIKPGWIKFIREVNSWDYETQQDYYEYMENGLKLIKKKLKSK